MGGEVRVRGLVRRLIASRLVRKVFMPGMGIIQQGVPNERAGSLVYPPHPPPPPPPASTTLPPPPFVDPPHSSSPVPSPSIWHQRTNFRHINSTLLPGIGDVTWDVDRGEMERSQASRGVDVRRNSLVNGNANGNSGATGSVVSTVNGVNAPRALGKIQVKGTRSRFVGIGDRMAMMDNVSYLSISHSKAPSTDTYYSSRTRNPLSHKVSNRPKSQKPCANFPPINPRSNRTWNIPLFTPTTATI